MPHNPPRHAVALITMLSAGVLIAPGCAALDQFANREPSGRVKSVAIEDLSLKGASLLFDVELDNPYDVDVPLTNLAYRLQSRGERFLSGEVDLEGVIPARGSRTLQLPADVRFASLLQTLADVRPGALVPYQAQLDVKARLPGLGERTLPVSKEGELPVPAVPEIRMANLDVQKLTLSNIRAVAELEIENTNRFPIDLESMQYAFALSGVNVAQSRLTEPASFKPGEAARLELPLEFSPVQAGLALLDTLRGGETGYRIQGEIAARTPFGPVRLPYDSAGASPISR